MLCPEKLTTYCFKSGQVNELTARLRRSGGVATTNRCSTLVSRSWQNRRSPHQATQGRLAGLSSRDDADCTFGKFIEQEQLMGVYEVRIAEWLEATEV